MIYKNYNKITSRNCVTKYFDIQHEAQELYLHLFLAKKSPQSNIYAPMSYIVLTKRDDNPKLYFEGQEHKKVIKLEILPIP